MEEQARQWPEESNAKRCLFPLLINQGGVFMELKMSNCEQKLHENMDFIHREQHVNDTANTAVQQEHWLYMKINSQRAWKENGNVLATMSGCVADTTQLHKAFFQ